MCVQALRIAWLALLGGCASAPRPAAAADVDVDVARFEFTEIIMAVPARIVLYAGSEAAARTAARAAFDRMSRLEAVMSDFRADSEVRVATALAHGRAVPIGEDLYRVLARAREIAGITDGAFDVTVGPLVALWREARRSGRLPPADAIETARARVGWRDMTLGPERRTLRLARPDMAIDLGGIGKGFAADEALKVLADRGVGQALVDLGGDIVVGDPPPGRSRWRVLAETRFGPEEAPPLELVGQAVATSGDTEQFVELDGARYSHIVDPRTGLGLRSRSVVIVVAPDGTTADALASALSVLGPEGLALLERFPGTSALIEQWTPDGVRYHRSAGFPR